jgi:hypothetical protein
MCSFTPILLRSENIIAGDNLRAFGREPELSSNKRETVWAIQSSGIDVG